MRLSSIKAMERLARNDPSIISLGQGIPDTTAAPHIKDYVCRALAHDVSEIDRYSDPQGIVSLRENISTHLAKADMRYTPDEIVVTVGAMEAINATLLALVTTDKNEVIVPTPAYATYSRAIQNAKGKMIPITLQEDTGWQLSLEVVEAAITPQTSAILLCNPNNPTGTMYDEATLRRICELANQHGFAVLLDEVYGNMIYSDDKLYCPCVDDELKTNIIRIVSFSKDFSLTGWRVGFMHSTPEYIQKIVPVHDALVNCAPVVSQYAAQAALEIFPDVIAANRDTYRKRRDVMQSYLDDMSQWFDYTAPDGGYYLFPRLKFDTPADVLCQELAEKAKVIAVPGDDFGDGGDQHIRLCFGRSMDDIETGMQRIKTYLEEHMI